MKSSQQSNLVKYLGLTQRDTLKSDLESEVLIKVDTMFLIEQINAIEFVILHINKALVKKILAIGSKKGFLDDFLDSFNDFMQDLRDIIKKLDEKNILLNKWKKILDAQLMDADEKVLMEFVPKNHGVRNPKKQNSIKFNNILNIQKKQRLVVNAIKMDEEFKKFKENEQQRLQKVYDSLLTNEDQSKNSYGFAINSQSNYKSKSKSKNHEGEKR